MENASQPTDMLRISNADGVEYQVARRDYEGLYAPLGFHVDGVLNPEGIAVPEAAGAFQGVEPTPDGQPVADPAFQAVEESTVAVQAPAAPVPAAPTKQARDDV